MTRKNEKPARVALSDVLAAISTDLVKARTRARSLAADETYGLGVSQVEIELTTFAEGSTEGGGGLGVQMYVFTADLRGKRAQRNSDQQTVRVRLAPSRGGGRGGTSADPEDAERLAAPTLVELQLLDTTGERVEGVITGETVALTGYKKDRLIVSGGQRGRLERTWSRKRRRNRKA